MFDRRNLTSNGVGSPIYKFEGHRAAVLCVQVRNEPFHFIYFLFFYKCDYKDYHVSVLTKFIILMVQWSPDKSSVFGSSAEDGLLNIWDYDKV